MYIEKLQVRGIRNIQQADLELSPGINLFFGLNGSGKTSLLEAVHILSRGRSFRTRNLRSVINLDDQSCTCFGVVRSGNSESAITTPVGVRRDDKGKFVFKVDGRQVTTASQLAEALPIQIINAESFQLLEGSPGTRRGFIDWGVFHVEHQYRELWSRFQKCLKQRNSLLRRGKIDRLQVSVWDREFCLLSSQIDEFRRKYLGAFFLKLSGILKPLGLQGDFSFRYTSGWDGDSALSVQLERSWAKDVKLGHTSFGPHRADLNIVLGKQSAAHILSRGQIKTLVFALKIAQGYVFKEKTGNNCIFLLDDLPSELDVHHRQAVCQQLLDMGVQVLVTGVARSDVENLWSSSIDTPALFHVEQGRVSRLEYQQGLGAV